MVFYVILHMSRWSILGEHIVIIMNNGFTFLLCIFFVFIIILIQKYSNEIL